MFWFDDAAANRAVTFFSKYLRHVKGELAGQPLILTEWQPYRRPDYERISEALREPIVFDGRNLWNSQKMREIGFYYYPIGRTAATPLAIVNGSSVSARAGGQ